MRGIIRLIVIIAGAVVVGSAFLPYCTIEVLGVSKTISLIGTISDGARDGIYVIILAGACVFFALFGNKAKQILSFSVLNFMLCCYEMYDLSSAIDELGEDIKALEAFTSSDVVTKGSGYYVFLVASIVLLVASILNSLANRGVGQQSIPTQDESANIY